VAYRHFEKYDTLANMVMGDNATVKSTKRVAVDIKHAIVAMKR